MNYSVMKKLSPGLSRNKCNAINTYIMLVYIETALLTVMIPWTFTSWNAIESFIKSRSFIWYDELLTVCCFLGI